jgi:hypothetical protein
MYESNVTKVLRGMLDAADRPLSVIEIGTAYGDHLYQLRGCGNLKEMVSIDPMYDWVPDLRPDDQFVLERVDAVKVERWNENRGDLPASLLISKSCEAAGRLPHSNFDVLVIDGCHHPASAVESDYWDFVPYLVPDHIAIFDDINHSDPCIAADAVEKRLLADGHSVTREEDVYRGMVRVLRISLRRQTDTP